MPKREATIEIPQFPVGPTSSRMVTPDQVFRRVLNLRATPEGGLRSVNVPLPWVPALAGGPPSGPVANPSPTLPFSYGRTHGIFHCRAMDGQRDILLLHTEGTDGGDTGEIWEWRGWAYHWKRLIGPTNAAIDAELQTPRVEDWPTQFVSTPTGVVIIPCRSRAYFYDGVRILPLGYDHAPGAPVGNGPQSSGQTWLSAIASVSTSVNDTGYAMDGLVGNIPSQVHPLFRYGRIGTIDTPGNVSTLSEDGEQDNTAQVMSYLKPYRTKGRVQWVDWWGNLSPLSGPSNDIVFSRQPSQVPDGILHPSKWVIPQCVQKQIAWSGVRPGPQGTIGRILFRNKDLENSGDVSFYEIPRDSSVNANAFATIPDNMSEMYPDNIPDGWLVNKPIEVMPFPTVKLADISMGVMFYANAAGDEGAVFWSLPGRWGTIGINNKLYPDPSGAKITGVKSVVNGCLFFTENSTFIVRRNDSGDGFRSEPVSTTIGCIAPSSIVTLRNGVTVWLGRDGFYAYANGEVSFVFGDHKWDATRFNMARLHKAVATFDPRSGEYRCWLSSDGRGKNNVCWTYDGVDWRERDEFCATGVCTTRDHRGLVVACGQLPGGTEGVFVQDSAGDPVACELTSAWIRSSRSMERASVRRIHLWLRETGAAPTSTDRIQVEVSRDYRNEVIGTATVETYPAVDMRTDGTNPDLWDTAQWADATWRQRRPYWAAADIDVGSCEVFRFKVTCTRGIEVLGVAVEEQPRESSGSQAYR